MRLGSTCFSLIAARTFDRDAGLSSVLFAITSSTTSGMRSHLTELVTLVTTERIFPRGGRLQRSGFGGADHFADALLESADRGGDLCTPPSLEIAARYCRSPSPRRYQRNDDTPDRWARPPLIAMVASAC